LPKELADPEQLCVECTRETPLYTRAVSYGVYQGNLRELIHLLKYKHVQPAVKLLGAWVAEAAAPLFDGDTGTVVVIPVPLHSSKFRERGFNQAEVTARAAMRKLSRLCPTRFDLNFRALMRKRRTDSQVGMTREQRRANLRGAFVVTNKEAVNGRRVLLIDDVFTTGATVAECSRVLLSAGASEVLVATTARTVRPEAITYSYATDNHNEPDTIPEGAAPGTAHSR
jgi:ComF family protein